MTATKWPTWPIATPTTQENVRRCLESSRWAISGPRLEEDGFEQRFARRFASFLGAEHCVPTANGTSGLVIALEALGVGAGDEVIIPGLSWVASASTVLAVNALPVMVDVDPRTLCVDPEAVRAAIGPRTRAVSIVHLYNSLCDLDALRDLCQHHGLALIEDCAQAHGAAWRNRRVGSWGDVGVFSMQQTKLLTAGEGGSVVTNDEELHRRLYQLRADGRTRVPNPRPHEMELSLNSQIMGSNYCMSELSAAVLLAQIEELDRQNELRECSAHELDRCLSDIPGIEPIRSLDGVTERTHYYYVFRLDPEAFAGRDASTVAAALQDETGAPFQPIYPPMPSHPLFQPVTKRRYACVPGVKEISWTELPEAERAHAECVSLHHPALLAGPHQMERLAESVEQLQRNAGELLGAGRGFTNPL